MRFLDRLLARYGYNRTPPPKPRFISVIARSGMTLERWRADDDNVKEARSLFKDSRFNGVMSVLRSEIPQGFPARGMVINDTMASVELGRVQGYMDCLRMIASCAEFKPQNPDEVPAEFGADEILRDEHYPKQPQE